MPFKSEKQRRYLFANEPEVAKKFAKDYNMGGVASMFRKRLSEGDDPFYEAWKKVYETNPDAAALNEKHDEYLEKYELEMSMQTSDAPMEETEETTEVVEETTDPLLNLFQPTDALNTEQAATTLFTSERPTGIMAAKGGRVALKGGGMDAATTSFSESFDKAMGNPPGTTKGNKELDRREKEGQDEADRINRQIEIRQEIRDRKDEKYDDPKDQFSFTPSGIKKRTDLKVTQAKDKYNKTKKEIQDKYKSSLKKKAVGALLAGTFSFGLTDVFNMGKTAYQLDKNKKEYETALNEAIANYKELGVAEFHHAVDTPIQTLEQELIDINKEIDKDDDEGDKDGPEVKPITLEVDEDYAQGEMLDFNMMSALEKIRENEAVRRGEGGKGMRKGKEAKGANKGGLAGLFRVKNQ